MPSPYKQSWRLVPAPPLGTMIYILYLVFSLLGCPKVKVFASPSHPHSLKAWSFVDTD